MFESTRKPLETLLVIDRDDPNLYQSLAEIQALEAAWSVDKKKDASSLIQKGLAVIEKALTKNKSMPNALLVKAQLHSLQAQMTKDAAIRQAAAASAKEAFESAFKNNPLLKRKHQDELRDVANLLIVP